MTKPDNEQNELLLEEAFDWLLRIRDVSPDAALTRQWEAWLDLSSAHRSAWAKVCRTWQVLGDVPLDATAVPDDVSLVAGSAKPSRNARFGPRRWRGALAGLAALGLLTAVFGPALSLRLRADFTTGTAETREITLLDGSIAVLAPDSALSQSMEGGMRHVSLLAGEAFFDVKRDVSRRFIVEASGADIQVLGTAFNVRETAQETRVELAHGAIALKRDGVAGERMDLVPGDAVTIDLQSGTALKSSIDPLDIGLWRQGRLAVTDQSVASVVEMIQQYHPAWIVVPDRKFAKTRVTGLYDIHDPDRALAALVEPFGGRVRQVSPYLRIVTER